MEVWFGGDVDVFMVGMYCLPMNVHCLLWCAQGETPLCPPQT